MYSKIFYHIPTDIYNKSNRFNDIMTQKIERKVSRRPTILSEVLNIVKNLKQLLRISKLTSNYQKYTHPPILKRLET